jgi:hypothetical protein
MIKEVFNHWKTFIEAPGVVLARRCVTLKLIYVDGKTLENALQAFDDLPLQISEHIW